jgi:LAO/AO transport system kinase
MDTMKPENRVLEGDVLAAARLISGIENNLPGAIKELESLYPHTGRAHILGIAGAPGAGKSTLLNTQINIFRQKAMTVGVVAIDPTSPFSGGAVRGDRIRMQSYGVDKDVFIRSLASRGWKGGLSRITINAIHVMDAMGKDIILVEAVGSGQGEIDIARVTDTSILILTPGMGDEIQMMKAGILEAADIFVINKADRDGTENLRAGLEVMLGMKAHLPDEWKPRIVLTEAISGRGSEQLAEEILKHREFLTSGGDLEKRRKERAELELIWAVESSVKSYIDRMDRDYFEKLVADLAHRRISPQSALSRIINLSKD